MRMAPVRYGIIAAFCSRRVLWRSCPGRAPSSRFPTVELATVVARAKSTAPFLGAGGAGKA